MAGTYGTIARDTAQAAHMAIVEQKAMDEAIREEGSTRRREIDERRGGSGDT